VRRRLVVPHRGRTVAGPMPGQDPRKEVLPFRDLFPTRIALALVESEQTDLVLGRGARIRRADCSRIPLTTPGIGWVWCDGEAEPARVRAGWVSDDDIAAMVAAYTPGTPGSDEDGDPVVIDLTDRPVTDRGGSRDRGSVDGVEDNAREDGGGREHGCSGGGGHQGDPQVAKSASHLCSSRGGPIPPPLVRCVGRLRMARCTTGAPPGTSRPPPPPWPVWGRGDRR